MKSKLAAMDTFVTVDAGSNNKPWMVMVHGMSQNHRVFSSQVEAFRDMAEVTGLVVTKLDGTARGGVVVSLAEKFGLPVHAVGVGESAEDMRPFAAQDYARSLMGLDPADGGREAAA